jgi:NAD(P)-dependent dehydrogenase (short-subunit alcohol dehydrogenase family)
MNTNREDLGGKMELENQVAFITGAGSGIGRASAVLFAAEGARVTVADVDQKEGQETVNIIKKNGGKAQYLKVDVSVAKDIEGAIKATIDTYGRLDILFNNAGIHCPLNPLEEISEANWDKVLDVNLKGTYLGCKYAIPIMKKQRSGNIISTASEAGIKAMRGMSAYGASKAGIISLTKTLALELADFNIRVNCICPGPTLTPIFGKANPNAEVGNIISHIADEIPLGRLGKPEEIAQAALYLISNEAAFITGHVLVVDGGATVGTRKP